MLDTRPLLLDTDFPQVNRAELATLQVNLGYLCNLACTHCHVNAGPRRTELMDRETVDLVLEVLRERRIGTLDLTGGSPEMNPHFRYLVAEARALGVAVMDRCNPTILSEPGYEDIARFLADHAVTVVASMPCYQEENVDKQRGRGAFQRSIAGLRALNDVGYGNPGSGLVLNLMYNPDGFTLPPPQEQLEADYRRELGERHGVRFNQLFALANMPISRFGARLMAKRTFIDYMLLLRESFEPANLEAVMCRRLVSVDYRGHLYDCDFNQMLGLPLKGLGRERPHLRDLLVGDVTGNPVCSGDHCFGCTAGQGSSCGGALS